MPVTPQNHAWQKRHCESLENAAGRIIAIADDTGTSIIDVLREMERYIVQDTKVGDSGREAQEDGAPSVPIDMIGYTLRDGRIIEVNCHGDPVE